MKHLYKLSFLLLAIFAIGFIQMSVSIKSRDFTEDDINLFASDVHVVVGDVPLIIPYVALSEFVLRKPSFTLNKKRARKAERERLDAFMKAASTPETAPSVHKVEIGIRTFGWDDDRTSLKRICSRLKREWSKSVCDDPWAPLQQAIPHDNNRFYLADIRKFEEFNNHFTVGSERVSHQLYAMNLRNGEPSVVCDMKTSSSKTRFCTAAVLIKHHLAAVWTVWESQAETPLQRAAREAKTLAAFVLNGLGETENFPQLQVVACAAKDPQAPAGIHTSPCDIGRNVRP